MILVLLGIGTLDSSNNFEAEVTGHSGEKEPI